MTISGNNALRIFDIGLINATISDLTIANGNAGNFGGGGISNNGTLTISNCTISGNSTGAGGGISSGGPLIITNSTFSGNMATGNGSNGGAIFNVRALTITNSTISGNFASNGNGGGLYTSTLDPTTVTITNSTISGNSAFRGGGVYNNGGTVNTKNTIIALNTANFTTFSPDVSGTLTSQGYNLIGNNSNANITPANQTGD